MKNRILSLSLFICIAMPFQAQETNDALNTGAANFLTIPTDARTIGMAGAGVALAGNDNAIFANGSTALLDKDRNGGVTYTFAPWMRDYQSGYSLNSIGGYYKINQRHALLAGFRFFNYPKADIINEGASSGKVHPKEFAIDLGYAYEIINNLAVSATVRFIHSDMGSMGGAKSVNAVAADIGASYKGEINLFQGTTWTAGLQLSNFGSKIKYLQTEADLPMLANLGGSITMPFSDVHKLMIVADGGYRIMPTDIQSFNVSAGAEYSISDLVMIRGGYHYGDEKKGDFCFATAGLGVNYKGVHLDFSWLIAGADNLARNTFWASLGYSF